MYEDDGEGGTITTFLDWCNSVNVFPTYYTRVIEEDSNRVFINDNLLGAPTVPTSVLSEINGSLVLQNLASSSLKQPIKLYFKLKDGYSFPYWLKFDERTGRIHGKPPDSVTSFNFIISNNETKLIEMYLYNFGESFNATFDKEKAILFGYAYAAIYEVDVESCPT